MKEERRTLAPASARTGSVWLLFALAALALSDALPERVRSGLRELAAAFRTLTAIDSSETKNGEEIDGPGGAL